MAYEAGDHADTRTAGEVRAGLRGLLGTVVGQAANIWLRHGALLGGLVVALYIVAVMAIGWLRPVHSWDMIAYLGAALRDQYELVGVWHAHLWNEIRTVTDPGHFAALSQGDAYRARQFNDPAALDSMMGMYAVKWLYVKLVGLLYPVFGAGRAGYVINIASMLGFGAVLLWWLRAVRMLAWGPIVVAVLMIAGFAAMAMGETPDLLNTTLALAAVLAFDRGRVTAGCLAAFAAVLVRPDSIIFLAGLMATMWLWQRRGAAMAALTFAAGAGAYVAISKVSGHPGWWPHLWFSTYAMQDNMAGFHPDPSLRVYVTAFAWNLIRSAFENTWLGLYAIALAAWAVLHNAGYRIGRTRSALLAATLGAVALKYVLFPLHDGRTYLPVLLPALLLLAASARDALASRGGSKSITSSGRV